MVELKFTNKALTDIDNIAEFIAKTSPNYAQKFVQAVFKEASLLKIFPYIGRIVPEIGEDEVREIFYQKYRIVYHIINDELIHIVTIQATSRDVKSWFS